MADVEGVVSYLRVSTSRQGKSGLGIEAQRESVKAFLSSNNSSLLREFMDVESGSKTDRPQLLEAISMCRLMNVRLVIAKIDRLSRDAHFLLGLQKSGIRFVAADMPEANELIVGIMAVVAQAERKMISQRTKSALQAAKARGTTLGNPRNLRNQLLGGANGRAARTRSAVARARDLQPTIEHLRRVGAISLRSLAAGLNKQKIPTPRGGCWSAVQVRRILVLLS